MTKKLSEAFFGDKKFTEKIYLHHYKKSQRFGPEDICLLFQPYTSKLSEIKNEDGTLSLLQIFEQFMQGVFEEFKEWEFQKFSSAVEIAAHVFEYSFENWLSQDQSFKYFSEVLVRHSLFRPPHSVCIFNYDELHMITYFWLTHFHRYYEQYKECMASELNEVLRCQLLPGQTVQKDLKEAKLVNKNEVLKFLS